MEKNGECCRYTDGENWGCIKNVINLDLSSVGGSFQYSNMPSRKIKTKIKKLNKGKDKETKEAFGEKYEK